jgi:3-dehydroquinate dehydratase-2
MKIVILNGPNLNLLGKREPSVYGVTSFEDYLATLREKFDDIEYFQSNVEGELINKLHEVGFEDIGIVMNAGGYTHTSVAIADAIASIEAPVVEVHISNIHAREEFRHQSLTAGNCVAAIAGLGLYGYDAAIEFLRKG